MCGSFAHDPSTKHRRHARQPEHLDLCTNSHTSSRLLDDVKLHIAIISLLNINDVKLDITITIIKCFTELILIHAHHSYFEEPYLCSVLFVLNANLKLIKDGCLEGKLFLNYSTLDLDTYVDAD